MSEFHNKKMKKKMHTHSLKNGTTTLTVGNSLKYVFLAQLRKKNQKIKQKRM